MHDAVGAEILEATCRGGADGRAERRVVDEEIGVTATQPSEIADIVRPPRKGTAGTMRGDAGDALLERQREYRGMFKVWTKHG